MKPSNTSKPNSRGTTSSPPEGRRRRWSWPALAKALVVLICLAWLGHLILKLGPGRLLEVVGRADGALLALSVLPVLGRFYVWAWKWTWMMRRARPVRFRDTLRALLAGNFVNLTTPSAKLAGGFVRAAVMRRHTGWSFAEAYGWSLADQVTNVLGNLLFFGLAGAAAAAGWPEPGLRVALGAAAAVSLALVAASLFLRERIWRLLLRRGVERWSPGRRFRRASAEDPGASSPWLATILAPLMSQGRTWVVGPQDLALAAVSFGCLVVANALALQALGAEAPLHLLGVVVVVGYLAGTVVGTLGGIGVTEVALIELYGRLGIPAEQAAAAALVHRATYYAVILALGGWCFLLELGNLRTDGSGTVSASRNGFPDSRGPGGLSR